MPQESYVLPGQPTRRLGKRTEAVHNEMHESLQSRLVDRGAKTLELTDNSIGQTRGWGESLLFVPGSPEITKPTDQHILRLGLWSRKYFGKYFEKNTNHEEAADSGIPLRECVNEDSNDCEEAKDLARSWLARCMRNTDGQHDICNQLDKDHLPTRLLDVRQALEKNVVRLVCPKEEFEALNGIEYASLSHCWGAHGAKENPKLLTTNLASRQSEGLDWDNLPRTFKDAFKIASWLNLEWLWIDSMCIIQDSPSDWKVEASMMDRVYMGAKINISADKGEDSRSGCFAERRKTDTTPLQLASNNTDMEWILTTENTFEWMDCAPSLSRAWIHRERQLSKRILHFTDKEMVWECCGLGRACFASETMPRGSPFQRVFNGETKFQIQIADVFDKKLRKREQRDNLHRLWNSTCQDLSNKCVTYASDLPVILSSLAREFHSLFNGEEYACGLWRSTLAESLTWWVPGVKPEYEDYIAPSWSWLSAACPVQLYHPGHRQHKRAVVDILYISRAFASSLDDKFGNHTRGSSMRVNGFLRKLRFYYVGPQADGITLSVIEEDEHGNDRIRYIGGDWDDDEGMMFRMTTDGCSNLTSRAFECYALFTTLDEWAQHRSDCQRRLTCLLLESESAIHNGSCRYNQYKRIGTLDNISDLYSFKLRYCVTPKAKVPEVGLSRDMWDEDAMTYLEQPPPDSWFQSNDDTAVTKPKQGDMSDTGIICEDCNAVNNGGQSLPSQQQVPVHKKTDQVEEDIWYLLAQYLCWVRWIIIREFKEEEASDSTFYSTSGESVTDESEWEQEDHQPKADGAADNGSRSNAVDVTKNKDQKGEARGVSTRRESESENPLDDTKGVLSKDETDVSSPNTKFNEMSQDLQAPDRHVKEGDNGNDTTDKDETSDERKNRRREILHLANVILRIHDHPSSGLNPITGAENEDEAWDRLQQVVWFESETRAYGTNFRQDPKAALYQFDDVLSMWQKTYGLVPWLEQLETSEFTIG
ncbi:hypothetical protein ACLX1H_004665 [Fusarium chlamydosporum]